MSNENIMKRTKKPFPEVFRFALDEWRIEYGLHLSDDDRGPLGRCWESHYLVVRGEVRGTTSKRHVKKIEATLTPRDFDPSKWKDEWLAIGSVNSFQQGELRVFVSVTKHGFDSLLTGIAAKNIRGADLVIADGKHSSGRVRSFYSVNPDEPME